MKSFHYHFALLLLDLDLYEMSPEPRTLSFKDLEKHSSGDDCWIAVHSKIYDVTDFLDLHPGGSGSTSTQSHNQI